MSTFTQMSAIWRRPMLVANVSYQSKQCHSLHEIGLSSDNIDNSVDVDNNSGDVGLYTGEIGWSLSSTNLGELAGRNWAIHNSVEHLIFSFVPLWPIFSI